jgi:hypothetical protein
MTTYNEKTNSSTSWPMFAALGAGVSAVLIAVGNFWDLTDNETGEPSGWSDFLPLLGVIAVATILVFGLVVRTATPSTAARRGLILAVLGLLSTAAFWLGISAVLAAAAVSCAMTSRGSDGRLGLAAKASIGVSVVTVALAVAAAIAG